MAFSTQYSDYKYGITCPDTCHVDTGVAGATFTINKFGLILSKYECFYINVYCNVNSEIFVKHQNALNFKTFFSNFLKDFLSETIKTWVKNIINYIKAI